MLLPLVYVVCSLCTCVSLMQQSEDENSLQNENKKYYFWANARKAAKTELLSLGRMSLAAGLLSFCLCGLVMGLHCTVHCTGAQANNFIKILRYSG